MTTPLKKFLAGLAIVAAFVPGLALADPTCAYVFGSVNGQTITTPAIIVTVPSSDALTDPVYVHVDQTEQTILGYSIEVPGAYGGTYGNPVFVPGVSQYVPSFSVTLPGLNLSPSRCVDIHGASVPAVPIQIPGSTLTLPGVVASVGTIIVNAIGNSFTAPGQVVTYNGTQIIVPNQSYATPSVPVGTPAQSVTVDINGTVEQARCLAPNS